MDTDGIPDEPRPLYFSDAEGCGGSLRHLIFGQRQIHMFGRVSINVMDVQRGLAGWETPSRIRVGPATPKAAAIA